MRNRTLLFAVVAMAAAGSVASVANPPPPKGVILVLIDDIGYGDIDILSPSSLETPKLDTLHGQSIRFTDFHVGTTCSPTRGALMTGRSVNAGGVWHTIAGRELLREDEQTIAEVFQANDWKTGIFGKWHLGDGLPFAPRFRGFDVSIVHGGGGVGQGPDHWGNDYYSGVDQDNNPTTADVYLENGVQITADRHCTDYWFERAKGFIQQSLSEQKKFFCYLSTNAAHSPFNEPFGYKNGFDGLIENIDDNMGWLDDFLVAEGIKDDVLLIFTTDNGTTGSRLGGLRGKKGSHYDGGHNVPCFWRWKNGGIGGTAATARDVASLTAAMDLMPTFIDLFGLSKPPGGNPLHGVSFKEMLLNPAYVPTERTIVVDTQRQADLMKWRKACVMRDEVTAGSITNKWRLIRGSSTASFELYDFLTDRDTDSDISGSNGTTVTSLSAAYDSWWTDVSQGWEDYPAFVVNEDKESELTLFSHSWIGDNGAPWSQGNVNNANNGTRTHSIRFDRTGRYRFELRRWAREEGGAIDGPKSSGGGTVVAATKARVTVGGGGEVTANITPGAASSVLEMDVPAGDPTTLVTALLDSGDTVLKGAYYAYISRIGDAVDTDGDGIADVTEKYSPPIEAQAHDLLCFSSPANLAAGQSATIVGNGPADTVATMADGTKTYRLDSAGTLWRYDSPDFGASATNLGTLFAGSNVHAMMSDGSDYYIHLNEPAGGFADNNVVRFPSVADLLAGTNGTVATSGSAGSTALMSNGTNFYKVRGGFELQETPSLVQLITANGTVVDDLFCDSNHSGLFSDGTNYYVQVTATTPLADSGAPPDTDHDSTPDYLDLDSDEDGTPDSEEAGLFQDDLFDTDNDGIPDYRDDNAVPAPFDHWKQASFARNWKDPSRSGETSDFDHDTLVTLAEYGLGTDPSQPDAVDAITVDLPDGEAHLLFTRNPDATDLVMTVQGTSNLLLPFDDLARSDAGSPYTTLAPGYSVTESPGTGTVMDVDLKKLVPDGHFFMRLEFKRTE